MRGGSKPSMCRTADQVPLNFECVDNRGDKALAAKELAQKAHCRGLVALGAEQEFPEPRPHRRQRATCTFAFPRPTPPLHPDATGCKLSAGLPVGSWQLKVRRWLMCQCRLKIKSAFTGAPDEAVT
jgi:hypothetical protein